MNVTIITPVHGTYEKYGNMIKEIGEKLDEQTEQPHEWLVVCDENGWYLSFARVIGHMDYTLGKAPLGVLRERVFEPS